MNELNNTPETIDTLTNSLRGEQSAEAMPPAKPDEPKDNYKKDPSKITPIPDSPLSADSIREMLEKKRREGGASTSAKPDDPKDNYKKDPSKITPITDSPLSAQDAAARAAAIKELENTLCSGKQLQLNPDGSLSVLGKKPSSSKYSDYKKDPEKAIPITDSPLSADSIREMLEKKRREGGASTSAKPADSKDNYKKDPSKITPITDSPLSAAPWYIRDPELYATEVCEIQELYPTAKPIILSDGRLCFDLIIRAPEHGIDEPADNPCFLIYDNDHPNVSYGSSAKIYPQNLDELEDVFLSSPVVQAYCAKANKPLHMPHILKKDGHRFLCNIDKNKTTDDLSKGIISGAAAIRRAQVFFSFVEGAVVSEKICKKMFEH